MSISSEEKHLIEKIRSGLFDGKVGDYFYTGKSTVWVTIKDGIITRFKQGPDRKYFDGKENVRVDGVLRTLKKWATDAEIIEFLKKFGWLINDDEIKKYSEKFKIKK